MKKIIFMDMKEMRVSSYMPDLHAATIKNFAMKFGWVNNSGDILKQLASRFNIK